MFLQSVSAILAQILVHIDPSQSNAKPGTHKSHLTLYPAFQTALQLLINTCLASVSHFQQGSQLELDDIRAILGNAVAAHTLLTDVPQPHVPATSALTAYISHFYGLLETVLVQSVDRAELLSALSALRVMEHAKECTSVPLADLRLVHTAAIAFAPAATVYLDLFMLLAGAAAHSAMTAEPVVLRFATWLVAIGTVLLTSSAEQNSPIERASPGLHSMLFNHHCPWMIRGFQFAPLQNLSVVCWVGFTAPLNRMSIYLLL